MKPKTGSLNCLTGVVDYSSVEAIKSTVCGLLVQEFTGKNLIRVVGVVGYNNALRWGVIKLRTTQCIIKLLAEYPQNENPITGVKYEAENSKTKLKLYGVTKDIHAVPLWLTFR